MKRKTKRKRSPSPKQSKERNEGIWWPIGNNDLPVGSVVAVSFSLFVFFIWGFIPFGSVRTVPYWSRALIFLAICSLIKLCSQMKQSCRTPTLFHPKAPVEFDWQEINRAFVLMNERRVNEPLLVYRLLQPSKEWRRWIVKWIIKQ